MRPAGSPLGVVALLLLWAAALPHHPFAASPSPRLGAGEWGTPLVALVTAWVLASVDRSDRWTILRDASAPLVVIVVGLAPSIPFALAPGRAIVQLAVLGYVASIFAIGHVLGSIDARYGRLLLTGLLVGTIARAVTAWLHPLEDPWLASGWPRPLGPAESPNMIALQSSAGAVAALVLRRVTTDSRARAALLASTVLLAATTLATLGHALIAALVAAAFAIWKAWRTSRPRAATIAGTAAILALLLLGLSARTRLVPLHREPPFLDLRPDLYAAAHEVALETFRDRPFTGVGLEGFHDAWRARDDGRRFAGYVPEGRSYEPGTPIDPHSTWLGYLAEGGLCGAAVLVVLVVLGARAARQRDDRLLDLVLAFAAAGACVADVLTNRELALVLGVLSVGRRPFDPRRA
jgi:O-antigen ligase